MVSQLLGIPFLYFATGVNEWLHQEIGCVESLVNWCFYPKSYFFKHSQMVSITILYLWTLTFSFDLLKNFLFGTFSLINQLPLNLYKFWSNDAYEWVSGILTVVMMPFCSCQRSEVLLMVILLPPPLSVDGLLDFGGVCDWRYDVVVSVQLLDLMMLLLWSSRIWCCRCCGAPGLPLSNF